MLTPSLALEAILFVSTEPVEKKRLATLIGVDSQGLDEALKSLGEALRGRGLTLVETGSVVQLRTAKAASSVIRKFRESELSKDIGKAGLETLAVIAYKKDGATRGDIDWVRGVNSSASLRTLLMRGLIEGDEDPRDRRRIRYQLTTDALAHMGVASIRDLPRHAELAEEVQEVADEAQAAPLEP